MRSQSSLGGLARGVLIIFEVTKRVDEIFYSGYKAAHELSFESCGQARSLPCSLLGDDSGPCSTYERRQLVSN
jgi:hypothetical protein